MAKKKSGGKGKSQAGNGMNFRADTYIRERARKLPLGKCYMTEGTLENGLGHVIITRVMPGGNLVFGAYLVDTYCLGVKDCGYNANISEEKFLEYLNQLPDMQEVPYAEAHNLILGAVEFAEEAGIPPHRDWTVAQYVLEEDSDDIPLIEYEYGYNGKHHLVVGAYEEDARWIPVLQKRLGDDFTFIKPFSEDDPDEWLDDAYFDDNDEDEREKVNPEDIDFEQLKKDSELLAEVMMVPEEQRSAYIAAMPETKRDKVMRLLKQIMRGMARNNKEQNRNPRMPRRYKYPKYPSKLKLHNTGLADILFDPDNYVLTPEQVDEILSLPHDTLVEDMSQIILYKIGQTYKKVQNTTYDESPRYFDHSLLHAFLFLMELKDPKGLPALLEFERQTAEFKNYFFDIYSGEYSGPAIEACAPERMSDVVDFILERGIESGEKIGAICALRQIAASRPEKRGEVVESFRRLLEETYRRLPKMDGIDAEGATWIINSAADLGDPSLREPAKRIDDTDMVNRTVYGKFDHISNDFDHPNVESKIEPIKDIYAQMAE